MVDWLQSHLPEQIVSLIDTSTLAIVPNEHVPKWPDTLYSDVVYRCQINRQPGYIVVAAEHQSRADEMMAFRMLRYSIELMNNHLNQGHKKLPIVLPVVLYHGKKSPYPSSQEIWPCFDNPALAKQWALRPFQLIDLTVQSNEEINQHGLAAVMEMLFKHARQRHSPLMWLEQLFTDGKMTTLYTEIGRQYFQDILRYFIEVCGKSADLAGSAELEASLALWIESVPQAKEDIMTFAQQLEKRGELRGMQQGIEKGIEKGEKQAALKIARTLLNSGLDRETVMKMTGLSQQELAQICH